MKKSFTGVFVLVFSLCVGLFWALPSSAATYTVNSTSDSSDGTCIDPFVDAASDCTLREAIIDANASAGADTITFNISTLNFVDDGEGQFVIKITSALPNITDAVTISGSDLWDGNGTINQRPGVHIIGDDAGAGVVGFQVNSSNVFIRGLTISGFSGSQIVLNGDSNEIGTNCDGSSDAVEHVNIINGASNGVYINTGADSNTIAGTFIGLNETGTSDAGNNTNGIYIEGDNNLVGHGLDTCDEDLKRTIVSGNGSDGIKIRGDNNKIQGDYIGLDSSGTIAIPNDDSGIDIQDASIDNIIGTDGNGVNDSLEANVISGNVANGISITESVAEDAAGGPDENRISGNTIGLNATQTTVIANGEHGVLIAADDIIIGWCDTTVSATLCSNGGNQATQANTIFTNSAASDGIHMGVRADSGLIYGNYIGVTASGTDLGNIGGQGIAIEKRNGNHLIGGPEAEKGNTISNFNNGVRVYITTTDSQSPAENITISGNTLTNNEAGVLCDQTLEFSSGTYTYENTLSNNVISDNTYDGISLSGCSWDIQSNEITNNGRWGIYILGRERPDDPDPDELSPGDVAGSNYDNPYDNTSPNDAANDLVSRPRIQSNTVSGNTSGGMYFLESTASNASTLLSDNTFASNNDQNHIEQAWYAAIEILDNSTAVASGTETVLLTPAAGTCSQCSGSTVDTDSVSGNTIWGRVAIDYNNAETWFTVNDYTISSTGIKTSYNPYTITVNGDLANHTGVEYTFDGTDNDPPSQGGAANGITTNGVYRYQVAEVETSSRPDQPTNISPADGATGVSLTPMLVESAFSDSAETHARTSWRIYSSSSNCSAGGAGNVYDLSTTSDLTQTTVPSGELSSATTYYWQVSYENNFGNTSVPSACTSFTTIQTEPSFVGTIDDQIWNEDETVSDVLDLDDYFSDQEGEVLTFSVNNSEPDSITVSINANNVVSFSSDADWNGEASVTFTACDTDAECASSNSFTATVTSVNDSPTVPDSGFSPADSDITSDTTPRISWDAATDPDHTASQLQYGIRLGTNSDPATQFSYSATTSADRTSHTVTEPLTDDTIYYYVIRAIDPLGAKSDWSEVQTFTVNSEVAPAITLTKEVDRVDEVSAVMRKIEKVLANVFLLPIPLPVYGNGDAPTLFTLVQIMLHTVLWLSVLGIGLLLVGLLAMGRSWHDVGHLLVGKPSRAFERIHQAKVDAVHAVSFHIFKKRLVALRSVLVISVLVFFSMVTANATEAPIILQSTIRALAQTVTVEPDNTIVVTVSYENTGDGSATSPIFTDAIPSGTNFVAGTLEINGETQSDSAVDGSTITVSSDTITAEGDSTNNNGTISYQLHIDNPYTSTTLLLQATNLTANELEEDIESNTLTLSVSSASVSGEVATTAGNGISGVDVRIYKNGALISSATTNSSGQYTIAGLGDGTYTIEAIAPTGYLTSDTRTLTVSAGNAYTDVDFTLVRRSSGDQPTDETDTDDQDTSQDTTQDTTDTNDTTDDTDTADEDTSDTLEDILIDLGVPDELVDDFTHIDLPSEDEAQLIQELTEQLNIISVNDQTNSSLNVDSSNTVVSSLVDDIGDLLFPTSNTILLEGVGPPNAKITVSICYVISETSTDSEGKWVMVIPESVLQPGENVFYATAEKDGVVSEQVEVARVVIDQPSLISRTALLAYISVLLIITALNLTGYIVLVRRQRRMGIKPHTQFWAWVTLLSVILSVLALFGSFAAQQWRTYDVSAAARQLQEGITMESLNDTQLPPGQNADFTDASTVHFSGEAPADTNLAITLCDNQPFRTTTATKDGTWDMFVPVDLLPTARFTISAQGVAGDWLGDPHRLVDLDIISRNLLLQVNILLTIAYVLLFISAATLWWHSQVNTVPRSTLGSKKINSTPDEEI